MCTYLHNSSAVVDAIAGTDGIRVYSYLQRVSPRDPGQQLLGGYPRKDVWARRRLCWPGTHTHTHTSGPRRRSFIIPFLRSSLHTHVGTLSHRKPRGLCFATQLRGRLGPDDKVNLGALHLRCNITQVFEVKFFFSFYSDTIFI